MRRLFSLLFILLCAPVLTAQAQTVRVGAISNSINNWPM